MDKLPDDLVLLPIPAHLTEAEVQVVDQADWWEARMPDDSPGFGVLLVSAKAIGYLTEVDPVDVGIDLGKAEVLPVAQCLHRYGIEDGFYHA